MKALLFAITLLSSSVSAQVLSGVDLRLTPSTLPSACRLGDVRVDSGTSSLQLCAPSNTWSKLLSGVVGVTGGGTGLTSGTSGGILGFTSSTTIASSVALTQNAIVLGGGAGATPTPMASLGTTTTVLHGNAAGAPTFGAVALGTDVSGQLPVANGGTALASGTSGGILGFTGTGTIASSALLGQNALVVGGGAGATPTALASTGTTTTLLHGNAAGVPSFSAVSLTADVSGQLGVGNGGTGLASGTSGGILGFTGTGTVASSALLTQNALLLGGGAGATPSALGSLGTTTTVLHGNAAGAPSYGAVSLTADVSGQLTVSNGGTGQSTLTNHGMLIGAGTSAITQLAAPSTGTVLVGSGASADPAFSSQPNGLTSVGINDTSNGSALYLKTSAIGTPTMTLKAIGSQTADLLQIFDSSSVAQVIFTSGGNFKFFHNAATPEARFDIRPSINTTSINTGSAARYSMFVGDPTNQTTGTGGGIAIGGYQDAGTTATEFAYLWTTKNNNTAGDVGSAFHIATRNNGTGNSQRVVDMDSSGNSTFFGTINYQGSSSGTITTKAQAAAGTYEWDWPTTAGSAGQILTSQGGAGTAMTWTTPSTITPTGVSAYNYLVNGAFDFWQAGTSATVTATGGGTPANTYLYQPDQWYVNNKLGGGTVEGIITFSQVTGVTNGSLYGAKAQITTAPTGTGIQNGLEIYQTLSNRASQGLYGQTASFTVLIKSLGNVNQAGVQFYYKTSEAKVDTGIGAEVTCTVNTSTFSACTINGQALGTTQTTSGVIGVRIRPTAVSTGNLYDLNNGLVIEQAMMNVGTTAANFSRQYNDPVQELAACQYFYEKSYDVATAPGTATTSGMALGSYGAAQTHAGLPITFKVNKRIAPSFSYWDEAGNVNKGSTWTPAGWVRADNVSVLQTADNIIGTQNAIIGVSLGAANTVGFHWVADSRL